MVVVDVVLVVIVAVAGVSTVGHGHAYGHDLLRVSRD
jgi:hydrogenase/urease accessory protein HupE